MTVAYYSLYNPCDCQLAKCDEEFIPECIACTQSFTLLAYHLAICHLKMAGVDGCNLLILSATQLSKYQPKIILLKIKKYISNKKELLLFPLRTRDSNHI